MNSGAIFYPDDELVCSDYDANPQPTITLTLNSETLSTSSFIISNNMVGQSHDIDCEARNVINGEIHTGYTSVSISVKGKLFYTGKLIKRLVKYKMICISLNMSALPSEVHILCVFVLVTFLNIVRAYCLNRRLPYYMYQIQNNFVLLQF